jgi:hypothetical protein
MNDVELQEEIQRYSTRFTAAAVQALEKLVRSPRRQVSDAALEQSLRYAASAFDIVSGPFPEQNLFDMIVFVRLCRDPVERRSAPEFEDEEVARKLADVFAQSELELWQLADRVIDESSKKGLLGAIDQWQVDHPNLVRVEGVRLSDLGPLPVTGRGEPRRGLFRNLKSANESADRALLLANRVIFQAHRMPFLVRIQARLAAREILWDAVERLVLGPEALPALLLREVRAAFHRGTERLRFIVHPRRARQSLPVPR